MGARDRLDGPFVRNRVSKKFGHYLRVAGLCSRKNEQPEAAESDNEHNHHTDQVPYSHGP
jgi:hypothetical protein